jgi:hypothetical protein
MTINSPESLPNDDLPTDGPEETEGHPQAGTKNHDGGIPAGNKGVGLGATHEPNTFEPEEAPETD